MPTARGGDAEGADEGAAHGFRCPVAAAVGNLLEPVPGVLEEPPRCLQPDPSDVLAGRHPGLGGERPGELPRGQPGPGGQAVHRQVGGRPLSDPLLHLAQRPPLRDLRPQLRAELGLTSRPPQEYDQLPGHGQGRLPAQVLFHQREGQVDAGGDPGRGHDVPVPDEDRLRVDRHLGKAPGPGIAGRSVRRYPPAGQQARLG